MLSPSIGKSIKSFTLKPLLNLLKAKTNILLDLYISICFDALTNYLHLLQYHLLLSSSISVFVKLNKHSPRSTLLYELCNLRVLPYLVHMSMDKSLFIVIKALFFAKIVGSSIRFSIDD